ncbi:gibberellin 2-beta-dioxygenase 5-like [Zingiber officinale]|nr:gibberellin 2-beta-dioxygenase 5-like [Zingiber officinale]
MLPPPEFRAPPPSPVAGAHAHAPGDGEELAGFLAQFLRVPKLNLPHRIFPQEATLWDPAEIDFRTLISPDAGRSEADLLKSAAAAFGCFRLANHGIPPGLIAAVGGAAAATFRMPLEEKEKTKVAKLPERSWGFEAEEVGEDEEFFWWCGTETLPRSFNDLQDKLQELLREIEKIAGKIEDALLDDDTNKNNAQLLKLRNEGAEGSLICLRKHAPSGRHNAGIIKHELLRMLVRSWSCSSCLSLHLAGGASEFHVYSKRGWYRFRPGHSAALIVTVGDQLQACSRGMYKHVVGKPVLAQGDDGECISMAFHCVNGGGGRASQGGKTVTLMEQVMVAAILAILYCFLVS